MNIVWGSEAWEGYLYWQKYDKATLERVNELIKDTVRNGHAGIGKPERLKGKLSDSWSKRIDHKNRFVYRLKDGELHILSCRGHYDD